MMERKAMVPTRIFFFFILLILVGCKQTTSQPQIEQNYPEIVGTNSNQVEATETYIPSITPENHQIKLWIDPVISDYIQLDEFINSSSKIVTDKNEAEIWISIENSENTNGKIIYEDYFVVAVPFINRITNLSFSELSNIWNGTSERKNEMLWIKPEDLSELVLIFNEDPVGNVIESQALPEECNENNCFKLINFSKIDPTWRIISVDNQLPLDKNFQREKYPLVLKIIAQNLDITDQSAEIISNFEVTTNFSPSLLTTVMLTGTTAMVRNTAFQMEQFGLDFPVKNLKEILSGIDVLHVSNEVPFYSQCPSAVPVRQEMRFCSDPKYVETLISMGVDVVELTGNHLLDWGPDAFFETMSIYDSYGLKTYGGGRDITEAEEPLVIEINGTKIGFLGCNLPGPENNWVSGDRPGSLPCDLDLLEEKIRNLTAQQINPIFTFQHNEFNTFKATQQMRDDFWRIAKAGAVIVSGSQAHYPQGIDFVESSFIHYGLGNFLFDQMYTYWAMATIDIHYFYNNHYINTKQIPIINENFGQPRIMNEEEEKLLFEKIYSNSFYYQKESQ